MSFFRPSGIGIDPENPVEFWVYFEGDPYLPNQGGLGYLICEFHGGLE